MDTNTAQHYPTAEEIMGLKRILNNWEGEEKDEQNKAKAILRRCNSDLKFIINIS